jgi:predicted ArsR family transcriptional regulator
VQSTKTLIITSIKRSGGSTVDELAQALDLAPMTVRQHLAALQRDDLVGAEPVRRATGRPHYVYRLTQRGDDTFPKRYDRLAEALLQEVSLLQPEEIESLAPDEKASLVLRRVADRLVDAYAPKVRGRALEEQVATVTEMLTPTAASRSGGRRRAATSSTTTIASSAARHSRMGAAASGTSTS